MQLMTPTFLQHRGPLPDKDGMLPNLRTLDISFNEFNGSIPASWSQTGIFSSVTDLNWQPFSDQQTRVLGVVHGSLLRASMQGRTDIQCLLSRSRAKKPDIFKLSLLIGI